MASAASYLAVTTFAFQLLQKNIGESIEQEIREQALKDGTELRILNSTQQPASKKSAAKDNSKKDKSRKT